MEIHNEAGTTGQFQLTRDNPSQIDGQILSPRQKNTFTTPNGAFNIMFDFDPRQPGMQPKTYKLDAKAVLGRTPHWGDGNQYEFFTDSNGNLDLRSTDFWKVAEIENSTPTKLNFVIIRDSESTTYFLDSNTKGWYATKGDYLGILFDGSGEDGTQLKKYKLNTKEIKGRGPGFGLGPNYKFIRNGQDIDIRQAAVVNLTGQWQRTDGIIMHLSGGNSSYGGVIVSPGFNHDLFFKLTSANAGEGTFSRVNTSNHGHTNMSMKLLVIDANHIRVDCVGTDGAADLPATYTESFIYTRISNSP